MSNCDNLLPNTSSGLLSTLDTPPCYTTGISQDLKAAMSEELFSKPGFQSVKEPAKHHKKIRKRNPRVVFNVSDTKYEVVKYVGKELFHWKLSYESDGDWDVFWTDSAVVPETLARMDPYQKINHFPCMYTLARKNHLGRYLMRMRKAFPDKYKFFPRTFLLPMEYMDFRAQFNRKTSTFIVKPEASCQGRGIFLTRTFESIEPGEHYVVQKYIEKPYLIDGLKFDLRVYVLLAGCDPLRIYIFNDGLTRFATEKYQHPSGKNLSNMCMHLTNYAINKGNPNFIFNTSEDNDNEGHKRSLKALFRILESQGKDTKTLWKEIKKLIIKTFCSVQPILAHTYKACQPDDPYNNMCFEILGFDIMLDHELKPWLIEVNHTPSFTTDTPLDRNIKMNVIKDALTLMNVSLDTKSQYKKNYKKDFKKRVLTGKTSRVSPEERQADFERAQKERDDWESSHLGGFQKIFPVEDPSQEEENYDEYLKESNRWWEEWTGIANKRKLQQKDPVMKDPATGKPLPTIRRGASPSSTIGKATERAQSPLLPKPKTEERIRRPVSHQAQTRNHHISRQERERGSVSGIRRNEPMEPQAVLSTEWSEKSPEYLLSFREMKNETRNSHTEGEDQTPTQNGSGSDNVHTVVEDFEEVAAKDTIQIDDMPLTRNRSKTCVRQLLEVTHSNLLYTKSEAKVVGDLPDRQNLFNKQFFLKQPSYRVKVPDQSAREIRDSSNEGRLTFNRKSKDIMNLIRVKLTTANPSYGSRGSAEVVHKNIDFGDVVNQGNKNSATRAAAKPDPNAFMKKIREPSGLGHVKSYLTNRRPSVKPASKQSSFLIPGQPAVTQQRPHSVLRTTKISLVGPEDEELKDLHASFSIQGYRAINKAQKVKEVPVRGFSTNLINSLAYSRERLAMQRMIEN